MTRTLLVLLAIAACGSKSEESATTTVVEQGRTPEEEASVMKSLLEEGSFGTAAFTLSHVDKTDDDKLRPDGAARVERVARTVAPTVLAKFDAIAKSEVERAQRRGVDRARGRNTECASCREVVEMLATVSKFSPEVAAKWKALELELAKAEAAAFDAEGNDKRPAVYIRAREDIDVMALDCVRDAFAKAYPKYKWIAAGIGKDAVNIVAIKSKVDTAGYRNTRTGEGTKLIAGIQVTLVAEHLEPKLAAELELPISASADADTPSEIKSDFAAAGVGPELEASRVGMSNIKLLTAKICGALAQKIDQAGK